MLDRELGYLWSFDIGHDGICYELRTVEVAGRTVKLYCVNIVTYVPSFSSYVLDYNLATIIRYVYEFEHPDNPIYIEDGLDYRRRDDKLSFGRFKTLDDALAHADKRLSRIDEKYFISDENKERFPIPVEEFDSRYKVFDAYVQYVVETMTYDGLQVDDLLMFNTVEDKIGEFFAIRVPFIKVEGKAKRELFGAKDVIEERDENGMSLYVSKDSISSLSGFMDRLRQELVSTYLYEIIATEDEFGEQYIPDGMFPEDEENKFT
jgi:hypothetical protein